MGEVEQIRPWERQNDTDKAWEAFEVYRQLGTSRSLTKAAEKLQKSHVNLSQWSQKYHWPERVAAWDRYQARIINQQIVAGTADMRQRMVNAALAMQARAQQRILRMSDLEISTLKPSEVVALMKAAGDMERKARDIDGEELGFGAAADEKPFFSMQIIKPGEQKIGVQFEDGRTGYIHEEDVEEFRKEHPTALVVA